MQTGLEVGGTWLFKEKLPPNNVLRTKSVRKREVRDPVGEPVGGQISECLLDHGEDAGFYLRNIGSHWRV